MTLTFFNGVTLTVYELLFIFFIYGFLGWCSEVAFATLKSGSFVNRGFLNGPICPIYGFGMVVVVIVLTPLTENILVLFLGSMLLTTVLEYFTGWILEKLFHAKWWDYSERKFNLKGYICLEFSILWGLACLSIMQILQPIIMEFIHWIPHTVGLVVLAVCTASGLVDLGATIAAIRGLQKRLQALTKLAGEMHDLSDDIGEGISDAVKTVLDRTEDGRAFYKEFSELAENNRAEEKALAQAHRQQEQQMLDRYLGERKAVRAERATARQAEFRLKLAETKAGQKRLLKAFPALKVEQGQEAVDSLRKFMNEPKKK